jgi:uncharacterized membrane protein
MNSLFWERAHGGLTHFPIVLIFVATLFDIISFFRGRSSEQRRDFGQIGYWLVILAALGAIAAVLSGLGLTKWQAGGTGMVRLHHLFVWPSFALILGLVVWRVLARNQMSRRVFACYLSVSGIACALIGVAGFVGGEMLLGDTISPITPTPDTIAEAAQGRHLFLMNCAHCHGDDARGDEGPSLYDFHKSDARIHQVITSGIKGEMPSFSKKLGEPQVRQLTVYLRSLQT